ncbi:MAG: hypothetical protein K0Q81_1915 [Paenibacillus sp.]|jgi:hypothetical protein|nr:hypothetical protein [Paenibacillus sp.]
MMEPVSNAPLHEIRKHFEDGQFILPAKTIEYGLQLISSLQSIQQERDRLIEGLKFIRDNTWSERFEDARQDAREALESIGVVEERT